MFLENECFGNGRRDEESDHERSNSMPIGIMPYEQPGQSPKPLGICVHICVGCEVLPRGNQSVS